MLITVNIQIFIILIVLFIAKQIKIYVILMIFALIHELAHTFTGICLKLKPKELKINPFGISILFETYNKDEKKKVIIALSGPLINIAFAIIFSFVNINEELKQLLIYSNILLGICNLIPIYPLDGGRIMKSLLKIKKGNKKANDITNRISNALVISLTIITSIAILIYQNIGLLLVIMYLWILHIKEIKRYKLRERMYRIIEANRNS